jgi:hypothetical protein
MRTQTELNPSVPFSFEASPLITVCPDDWSSKPGGL